MLKHLLSLLTCGLAICNFCLGQVVPIDNYSVNSLGQVQLEIQAQSSRYYVLHARHSAGYEDAVSITMGVDGTLIISEPAGAYDLEDYEITEHRISEPDDIDGDGIDDITEFNNMPTNAPLNYAEAVSFIDGTTSIDDAETFASLAVIEDVPWAPFLNGQQFVKFGILDRDTDEPKVYFINSETHFIHAGFFDAIDANVVGDDGSGEIVYNPNEILPNGAIGSYSFNFSFGDAKSFGDTQRTFELLVANMPFLQNNMQHFIGSGGEALYQSQYAEDFEGSRINVVLESEVFADIDYIPFNRAEGYGYFRHMSLDENPGSRDIVLYDALPNSLPRVGGIITSVVQTPLSHVNLRAIQDNVPNAYIKNPLQNTAIASLLNNYIYYRVEDEEYVIREASLDEVNAWYENIRPTESQVPVRDLSQTEILPLDEIGFGKSTAFGAKCSNVSTMRTFGFPEGAIPDGFGVPFYFYDEFMKFNNFYQAAEDMMAHPDFATDIETRIDLLDDLRDQIRDAPMPQWMLDELQAMHESFPVGTSVRCRSSTNNEDLPGFSGAGLYTSKTQHPHEGHIQKSIKQVYASMWNFRAFEERDFYRVDHFKAAMGVLCHPNYQEEKSNGVGISIDPIYQTANTFYLNTQVGESLVTNPDENSIPEELLLYTDPQEGYFLLRESNLVTEGDLVMDEVYLNQMRNYLQKIHDEFAILYNVVGAEGFGMDIEYKVTAQDQLIIKQARPWVSFWADINSEFDLGVVEIIEPKSSASLGNSEMVTARISNQGLNEMSNFDLSLLVDGQLKQTMTINETIDPFSSAEYQFTQPQDFSIIGDYTVTAVVTDDVDGYANNDTLNYVLSKLHVLEGGIAVGEVIPKCGEEVEIRALVTNLGESTFDRTVIEVTVNGSVVDNYLYTSDIPYLAEEEIAITVTSNLQQTNNEISLKLVSVNGEQDAVPGNNTASTNTDLTSTYDFITLVINADDYPEETSWRVYDELRNEVVASGSLSSGVQSYTQDICVDYSSCLSVEVFDSYGDGICCDYGEGDFSLLNASGQVLLTNDGDFGSAASEFFCPNGEGCEITANITVTNASDELMNDGELRIATTSGFAPFKYSINGGQTFVDENVFTNLSPGDYSIMIVDTNEICTYEETVTVEVEIITSVDEQLSNGVKVYPNPTSGNLTIEINSSSNSSSPVFIQVYDQTGRVVQSGSLSMNRNTGKTEVSLGDHSPGLYFIRCYNDTFKEFLTVVKIH